MPPRAARTSRTGTERMRLFSPLDRRFDAASARTWARFEIAYTGVDFAAALLFVIGSVLFFGEDTQRTGTWFFLIGSLFFALKPTLRLARELWFLRRGADSLLAKRAESDFGISHDEDGTPR